MLERLRDGMANVLSVMAQGITTDKQRNFGNYRIPYSGRTLAGLRVTPDDAVTIPTVWACLRYLSQTVAVMPWHVMLEGDDGAEIADGHGIDKIISTRASSEWSSFQFRETLTHWALRWGNGYAEIEPDQAGRPFALWPIHPERVRVCRAQEPEADSYGEPIAAGELYYEITQGSGTGYSGAISLSSKRMFHIRGFGEGPVGVNVIHYAAESLGWAKAAQLFGASFFGNGANVAGVVINKKPLKEEGLRRQKREFEGLYKGPRNANKTAFLDNDADWKAVGGSAESTQLNATNQALVSEVCRWFGVPPHKVMDLSRATFSNIEHQAIEVVVDSVSPWAKRFEDEADYKFFGQNRQGYYTKMNMRGLMRGDFAARVSYYDGMVKIGAYSPNRVLELEDENTIGPDGDIHVMQNQNVTLKQIADGVGLAPTGAPGAAPAAPAAPSKPEPDSPAEPGPDAPLEGNMTVLRGMFTEPTHAY